MWKQNNALAERHKKELADRIKAAVQKSGRAQKDIAYSINTTETSISRYINGQREPKATVCAVLAKELGVSLEWLFYGKEN